MPKLSDIKTALKNSIAGINPSAGYLTGLSTDRVKSGMPGDGQAQAQQGMQAYPRCTIFRSGNGYEHQPNRRLKVEATFTLIFSMSVPFRQDPDNPVLPLDEQIENLYADIERWVDLNAQLGGSDLVTLIAIADDQGTSETEATVVAEIRIAYRRNMAA